MNVVRVRQCSLLCASPDGISAKISGYGAAGEGEGFSDYNPPSTPNNVKSGNSVDWDKDWSE